MADGESDGTGDATDPTAASDGPPAASDDDSDGSRDAPAGTDSSAPDRTTVWAFATFDACAFLLVPLLALHEAGVLADLLGGLGTLPGVATFLYLWALVAWGVRWTLSKVGLDAGAPGSLALHAFAAGGVVGAAFLLGVGLGAAGPATIAGREPVGEVAIVLGIGAAVAVLVGGIVGLLAGLVNLAAHRLAGVVAPDGVTPADRRAPDRR